MQKFKTFKGTVSNGTVDAMCEAIDQKVCEFLADGKRVIRQNASLAVRGQGLVYLVSLTYEDPTSDLVALCCPVKAKTVRANNNSIDAEEIDNFIKDLDACPIFSHKSNRQPMPTPIRDFYANLPPMLGPFFSELLPSAKSSCDECALVDPTNQNCPHLG